MRALVLVPAFLAASAVAHAAPVFTQTPDQTNAVASEDPFIEADNFTLAGAQTIRSIVFWGGYGFSNTPQAQDDFVVRFYNDVAGLPGSSPIATSTLRGLTRTATGALIAGFVDEYRYEADLVTQVSLSASTTYWISISNDTSIDPDDDWFWEVSGTGDNAKATSNDTGMTWNPDNDDHAFQLDNIMKSPPQCEGDLFFQQLPDQSQAQVSDLEPDLEIAESFTPTSDIVLRGARFWGAYGFAGTPQATDEFRIRVFKDASGAPALDQFANVELVSVQRASTGAFIAGLPEYLYAAELEQPLLLEAGNTYWVAIVNDTTVDPNDDWFWEYSGSGDNSHASHDVGMAWNSETGDLALELCGDELPDPDCLADLNGDGEVDAADLALLLGAWGLCP